MVAFKLKMRGFSSEPHRPFTRGLQVVSVNANGLSRVALASLIMGVLVGGVALGRIVTAYNPAASPSASAIPTPTTTGAAIGLGDDVAGEDIRRLPRYPGSVRTEYEAIVDERYRLTITEFMVDAPPEEVRLF